MAGIGDISEFGLKRRAGLSYPAMFKFHQVEMKGPWREFKKVIGTYGRAYGLCKETTIEI